MRVVYRIAFVALAAAFVLSGCNRAEESSPSPAALRGKSPRESIAIANEWMGNGVTTYVTTQAVNFEFPNGRSTSIRLPDDEMVVAIAPYVDRTHPCGVHYMSGCQGELVGVPVAVQARAADGTMLVNETIHTMANGFIELWLPRGLDVNVTLSAEGRTVTQMIGTHDFSNTCITTMQLL